MHQKPRLFILFLLLFSIAMMDSEICAQTLTNVDFTTKGDQIEITYDLIDGTKGEKYDIDVYLIKKTDKPIRTKLTTGLTGDLTGTEGGLHKLIIYDVLTDRDQLDGTIQFELRISKTHRVKLQLWKQDKGQTQCALEVVQSIKDGRPAPIAFAELHEVMQTCLDLWNQVQKSAP